MLLLKKVGSYKAMHITEHQDARGYACINPRGLALSTSLTKEPAHAMKRMRLPGVQEESKLNPRQEGVGRYVAKSRPRFKAPY